MTGNSLLSDGRPASVQERIPLGRFTSLKVGGPAEFYGEARTIADLVALLRWGQRTGLVVRILGGGTNLLIADEGVNGLVIRPLLDGSQVLSDEPMRVSVGSGVNLANLARRLARQGVGGLEWAANVPGTVGGAVVNNAGAFGGDTASCLVNVQVVGADGDVRTLLPTDLDYAYRTSRLKRRDLGDVVVTHVQFRVVPCASDEATTRVAAFQAQRTASQPRQLSAGSVFANPPGDFSGRLIESVELKGIQVGGAQISLQHANFIVNSGGATARNVYDLARLVQQTVYQRCGVWLLPEIELLGRWSADERLALRGPVPGMGRDE